MKKPLITSLILASSIFSSLSAFADSGWKRTSSLYEVPVPEHLKEYAFFEINDVRVRTKNGVEEIKYNLPLELTGVANRIRLKSNADGSFSGPKAEGTCSLETCSLKYRDLKFDEVAVRDLLERQGFQGLELENRLEVFERFSGDPAGIIHRKRP